MSESQLGNLYSEAYTLVGAFIDHLSNEEKDSLDELLKHLPPEQETNEEAKKDLEFIIEFLKHKKDPDNDDQSLLQHAQILLSNIHITLEYASGEERTKAKHPIHFNFEHLYQMSDDPIYKKILAFTEERVQQVFHSKHGTRIGTVSFYNALDVLTSFYYYVKLIDDMNEEDKKTICKCIYDIATSMNKKARKYLIKKDPAFKAIKSKKPQSANKPKVIKPKKTQSVSKP